MADKLKVLTICSEAVPFAKTGGLADVAGALPSALRHLGVDVRLVLPFYRNARRADLQIRPLLRDLEVSFGKGILTADVFEAESEQRVQTYLIKREDMYDRPSLYGNGRGDYYDNLERFSFFSHAALGLFEAIGFTPDVIHCHDWQTGIVPALLSLSGTPSVFTIHNIGYQGIFPEEKFPFLGLSRKEFFHPEGLEFWGNLSLLKAGIVYADAVTTVSPKYAQEIQTPEYGMGMEEIVRHRRAKLYGILNGADYRLWDPSRDPHLAANYSAKKLEGKQRCKDSLIQEMDLAASLRDRPLLGMTSRLDPQKGLDILVKMLDDILALEVGLVILGSGDEVIERAIEQAAKRHSGRIRVYLGFDEPLAHRIIAGVDMFLTPSRYEPCGLTQMYALKYGTVPVARATGGLDDTIRQFDPRTGKGNGFKFGPYEPKAFLDCIRDAVDIFKLKKVWQSLMGNGMKEDFSWERSAGQYLEIYEKVTKVPKMN